ncbi:carboxypeptidase N subunit 2 [Chanos chanos]|uniref:Carboxypeptidase N subunit 2 n=1 Tax=Chanos chanos TaxID=29144 RepID=A0A6J2V4A2_CHACN|nr:carboxypeptidase N subunit 2-like [Chanos chanos]
MTTVRVLVLAVFASCCCNIAISCPEQCEVSYDFDAVNVICRSASFVRFPGDCFPRNTTSLTIRLTNISNVTADDSGARVTLDRNNLSSLPANLLQNLSKLKLLDLKGNRLTHLPPGVFHHAPLLELILRDNLISEVHPDVVSHNTSLTRLDLSGNQLKQPPVALLQRLGHLESLDLRNNQLEELPPKALDSLPRLDALYLERNQLKALDVFTFRGTPHLQQVFLGNNRLENLPAGLFQHLSELVFLDLGNNLLQRLAPGTLDGRYHVVLRGNPWHCQAELAYLRHWLGTHEDERVFLAEKAKCHSPDILRGRAISSLTNRELGLEG